METICTRCKSTGTQMLMGYSSRGKEYRCSACGCPDFEERSVESELLLRSERQRSLELQDMVRPRLKDK